MGNCVGHDNYKAFCLLLFYGLLATFTTAVWWWPLALGTWRPLCSAAPEVLASFDWRASDAVFFALVLDSAFFCALCLFCGIHLFLLLTNRTTLESHFREPGAPSPYSLGSVRANFTIVFGGDARLWGSPAITADVIDATLSGTDFARSLQQARAGEPVHMRDYAVGDVIADKTADVSAIDAFTDADDAAPLTV